MSSTVARILNTWNIMFASNRSTLYSVMNKLALYVHCACNVASVYGMGNIVR